ncbi:MAG TPA: hypothetical protein VJ437_06215 [Acidiferrobacterales bacterium]|nr:hypothetical protein [Acidiferrobacterales bacterium]
MSKPVNRHCGSKRGTRSAARDNGGNRTHSHPQPATRVEARAEGLVLITDDPVLRDAILVLRADIRKVFDKDGRVKPLSEIDADTAAGIESIKIKDVYEGEGDYRMLVGETVSVTMRDKLAAISTLLDTFESLSRNQGASQ